MERFREVRVKWDSSREDMDILLEFFSSGQQVKYELVSGTKEAQEKISDFLFKEETPKINTP